VPTFAYLSVLTSIVLGLGIARLLTGLGRLLQARGRVRLYWVHMLWALNLLLFQRLTWWILFRWQSRAEWAFFPFLFLLLSPTVSFLLTVLLFPDGKGRTCASITLPTTAGSSPSGRSCPRPTPSTPCSRRPSISVPRDLCT